MLVLPRQKGESIMFGDDVEVTIVRIKGNKVRLGIAAPKDIPVHRREIYDAIQREKAQKIETAEAAAKAGSAGVSAGSYFKCGGAYDSEELVQDAYIEVFPNGRIVKCTRLDSAGYCHLDLKNTSNKCPHNIERLV